MLPRFPQPDDKKGEANAIALAEFELRGAKISNRRISEAVKSNLEALELGMSAPVPKVVFIQGGPGSGKEGFANAIHAGSKLARGQGTQRKPKTRSLAGMRNDQFRTELFGEEVPGGAVLPGLIANSGTGTLFLDEFDKLDAEASGSYAELLRVWEAKEFVPVKGRSVTKMVDLNWVVAGAFTSNRTTADLPPDIWSRFNAQLVIESPLASSKPKRDAYLYSLIPTFMLAFALERVGGTSVRTGFQKLCGPETPAESAISAILFGDKAGDQKGKRLQPSVVTLLVARALAKYLGEYRLYTATLSARARVKRAVQLRLRMEQYSVPSAFIVGGEPKIGLVPRLDKALLAYQGRIRFETELVRNNLLTFRLGEARYDGIRTVKQACRLVVDRLLEMKLREESSEERVAKMFLEAFTVVDLARSGNGLAQGVSRASWSSMLKAHLLSAADCRRIAEVLVPPAPTPPLRERAVNHSQNRRR